MPLYDWECRACGAIFEAMAPMDMQRIPCIKCDPIRPGPPLSPDMSPEFEFKPLIMAERIISTSRGFYRPDAPWIETVREVVDKDDPHPAVRRFLETPNRRNHQAWMKYRGIRPMEDGERPIPKPPEIDHVALSRKLLDRHKDRCRIEVR